MKPLIGHGFLLRHMERTVRQEVAVDYLVNNKVLPPVVVHAHKFLHRISQDRKLISWVTTAVFNKLKSKGWHPGFILHRASNSMTPGGPYRILSCGIFS